MENKWWDLLGNPESGQSKFPFHPQDIAGLAMLRRAILHEEVLFNNLASGYYREGKDEDSLNKMALGMGFRPLMQRGVDTLYILGESLLQIEPEDKPVTAKLLTLDEKLSERFHVETDEILEERHEHGVYVLVESGQTLELRSVGQIKSSMVRENYTPEVLYAFDYVAENLRAVEPDGRLSIFNGPPGTGKTHLIKGLINSVLDCDFVVISPDIVKRIAGPQFITLFSGPHQRKRVLVLEDADSCLAKRAADSMSDIQAVLNLADGIIGQLLDFRIVATTNAKKPDFDSAIMRNGRLCKHIEMGPLPNEQAMAIYERITGTKTAFPGPLTLADVYAAAKGRHKETQTEKRVGFAA